MKKEHQTTFRRFMLTGPLAMQGDINPVEPDGPFWEMKGHESLTYREPASENIVGVILWFWSRTRSEDESS